jgi:hypothetical protein
LKTEILKKTPKKKKGKQCWKGFDMEWIGAGMEYDEMRYESLGGE